MKIKLKSGNEEIEVEGSKPEVDHALKEWWTRLGHQLHTGGGKGGKPKESTKRSAHGGKGKAQSQVGGSDDESLNPVEIANAIKEDQKYALYEGHILHRKNFYNKMALVSMYSNTPLTSGEVAKVLRALDVKADRGNTSNQLKKNSGKFLATAARKKGGKGKVPRYKLTSSARAKFEAWLKDLKQ